MKENIHWVLLPGMDGTGNLFAPFASQFDDPQNYTVISYPADYHVPYKQLPGYIKEQIPTNKTLVLLGESYSGPAAIMLAAEQNLDIGCLILVSSFAKFPSTFLKHISRVLPISLLLKLPIPNWLIKYYCFGEWYSRALGKMLRNSLGHKAGVIAQRLHDASQIDVVPLLPRITMPCLYIQATKDKLVPPRVLLDLEKGINKLYVIAIEGPHFILQARPECCYGKLYEQLKHF